MSATGSGHDHGRAGQAGGKTAPREDHDHGHEHHGTAHPGDQAPHIAHDHDHGHGHDHHHHHHHHLPDPSGNERAFAIAVTLNVAMVVVQAVYGVIAHSTALLADAGHNLSDVLGMVLAWGAIWLARRRPSARYTYGLRGSSILASLANAALLFVATGAIAWEAVHRLLNPAPVAGLAVFLVAVAGIAINGFSALLFMKGSKDDLNIRGAFLHLVGDAAVSAAVALSGLLVLYTGWNWLDPAMSLIVVLVIVCGTWGLLRESVRLTLNAVPERVDTVRIARYLAGLQGVTGVHDLHVWALSTTENSLTVHLVMPGGHPGDRYLETIVQTLAHEHAVHHATLQIDLGTHDHPCSLDIPAEAKPG
ncbi:cation diffusion facilitator family transporter [Pararobbsia alpina]|uniref:Cadmium, cobalt and zinc/H(+)-K(+) antiporter n=1 Tax=Pararobbsia alpina TaxID=621374 RepID=A0A6S7B0J3_9BURK|nr:cation diffusion facilitator family transporter [Pararobbsia alpina]CAB3781541.1 Cadmium, cobalt and zinc/H(+)-K(+) antiporter [Pararobbsia alpina]